MCEECGGVGLCVWCVPGAGRQEVEETRPQWQPQNAMIPLEQWFEVYGKRFKNYLYKIKIYN